MTRHTLPFIFISTLLSALLPTSHGQFLRGRRPLKANGLITDTDLPNLTGVTYHSVAYEPICGTLSHDDTDDDYNQDWSVGGQCNTAMDTYLTLPDPVVIYDRAGVRVPSSVIGRNASTCLCYTLNVLDNDMRGHFCVFFDEVGNLELRDPFFNQPPRGGDLGGYVSTTYRRSTSTDTEGKAIPHCAGADLDQLRASWSETALGVGTPRPPASRTSTSALVTSVLPSTSLSSEITESTSLSGGAVGSSGSSIVSESAEPSASSPAQDEENTDGDITLSTSLISLMLPFLAFIFFLAT